MQKIRSIKNRGQRIWTFTLYWTAKLIFYSIISSGSFLKITLHWTTKLGFLWLNWVTFWDCFNIELNRTEIFSQTICIDVIIFYLPINICIGKIVETLIFICCSIGLLCWSIKSLHDFKSNLDKLKDHNQRDDGWGIEYTFLSVALILSIIPNHNPVRCKYL